MICRGLPIQTWYLQPCSRCLHGKRTRSFETFPALPIINALSVPGVLQEHSFFLALRQPGQRGISCETCPLFLTGYQGARHVTQQVPLAPSTCGTLQTARPLHARPAALMHCMRPFRHLQHIQLSLNIFAHRQRASLLSLSHQDAKEHDAPCQDVRERLIVLHVFLRCSHSHEITSMRSSQTICPRIVP